MIICRLDKRANLLMCKDVIIIIYNFDLYILSLVEVSQIECSKITEDKKSQSFHVHFMYIVDIILKLHTKIMTQGCTSGR